MTKNFATKLLSQGSIELDNVSKNAKKIPFLGNLIKISISVLNFSAESVEKSTIYDLLFLVAIYSPKNGNKHPSDMRNHHQSSHFAITEVFLFLRPIWRQALNFDLRSNFSKIPFACKLSYKKCKSVKHRVISSFFKRQQLIKDSGAQIYPPLIWTGLSELDNSYAQLWCENSLFCNYFFSKWYQKQRICNWLFKENKFAAAFFWVRYFIRASSF